MARNKGKAAHYANRASAERVREIQRRGFTCDANDAAAILGICPRGAKRLARDGRLPGAMVGGVWRFNVEKLIALVSGEVA